MPSLVALDLPGGPEFVDELRRAWERGDAVLPVDQRLPAPAKERLLESMRPDSVVDAQGDHRRAFGRPTEEGDALVVATSGSTGDPKGVVLTHSAVEASARASSRALEVDSSDHWLACLPMAHIGGLSVVTRSLITGVPVTVIPTFAAEEVTRLAHRCTLTALVGTALARIDPRLYRAILLGGGRPPENRPPNTVATYGLTETGSGVVYDGWPLDGVEVSIAEDGEILLRGPMLMRCYRDGTTVIDADGWLHTDDLGHLQHDGRLHVEGRRGDVIVTGGQKVWPEAVERVLAPFITGQDFCIIGIPDPQWGDRVVLATTDASLSLDRIRGHVKEALPAYCAPQEIVVVPRIERTALGKVQRTEMRKLLKP
ncbi:MAG: AMP-binding protein [Ilumatobacteraceae bacterium]